MFHRFIIFFTSFSVAFQVCAFSAQDNATLTKTHYLPIEVAKEGKSLLLSGVLKIPSPLTDSKIPAVLILHGSAGVDNRGDFYAEMLNANGIATFEIDLWGGRGLIGGSQGRPKLPTMTLPDAFSALTLLAERPEIDKDRIGVLGFSWGGVMTMLLTHPSVYQHYEKDYRFSTFVAHYPICWAYNVVPSIHFGDVINGPLLIQTAEFDDYDTPDSCQQLITSLTAEARKKVQLKIWPKVYHAWDRLAPTMVVDDPFSHQGKGGKVTIASDYPTAQISRKTAVDFFSENFSKQ